MILVDTGIWIDFFANRDSPEVDELIRLIENGEEIFYTGVILQELAQGCSSAKQAALIEEHFVPFSEVFVQRSTYLLAAKVFRDGRAKGYPIRSSIDCLIAACAIEAGCSLLQDDRDYDFISRVSRLKLHKK